MLSGMLPFMLYLGGEEGNNWVFSAVQLVAEAGGIG